jgi:hypothetical protein
MIAILLLPFADHVRFPADSLEVVGRPDAEDVGEALPRQLGVTGDREQRQLRLRVDRGRRDGHPAVPRADHAHHVVVHLQLVGDRDAHLGIRLVVHGQDLVLELELRRVVLCQRQLRAPRIRLGSPAAWGPDWGLVTATTTLGCCATAPVTRASITDAPTTASHARRA